MARHEIALFLELVRRARHNRRLVLALDRDKDLSTITNLGLKQREILDAVAGLLPEQALNLPWDNRNDHFPNERVCDFGSRLGDTEVYIKVTAGVDDSGDCGGCVISFHQPERPLIYPYR